MVSFELGKEIKKDVFWSCHERRTKKKVYEFFIWSCTSTRQVLKVLRKYYRLEVQLAYLVDFAQFLLRFAPHLLSCTPNQSYTSLNHFFNEYVYIDLFLIWSCTSTWQDLMGLRKYYQLEVQLADLVEFTQLLPRFAPDFPFLHSKLQCYTPWNHFFSLKKYIKMFFCLVPQLVVSQGAQKRLPTRGTACIFSQLCPIFIEICSTFYFLRSKLVFGGMKVSKAAFEDFIAKNR